MVNVFYQIAILITFLAIFWVVTQYSKEKTFLRIVMFGSLCYGVLIAVLVRTIFGDILEDPAFFPDAYSYLNYATQKVAEWHGKGALGYTPLVMRGYTYFIAIIYSVFGHSVYAVIFVQLLMASLIPFLTFLIAREFFDIKTAKLSALLVAFFPDFYVWASFALKEILAIFVTCLSVYGFLRFRKHPDMIGFLTMISPLMLLLFIRPYVTLFLGIIFIFAFLWPFTIKKGCWLAVMTTVFIKSMSQAGLSNPVTMIFETPLYVYSRGEILVTGTLPELLRMVFNGQLLPTLLLGIGRYFVSPLPWQASNAYQATIPGIILWYFLLPITPLGILGAIKVKKKYVNILLFIVLFLVSWYGLISTGTDPRWRLMIVPFMSIFNAYGLQLLRKNQSGPIIWIFGVLVIWICLSVYTFGMKFALWILRPIVVVGMLVSLCAAHKWAKRVTR